jgi:hypothetical protein
MSEPERELEDMQEHSERLKRGIEDVREDWQRKQADEHVPGASGEPEESEESEHSEESEEDASESDAEE